MDLSYHCTGWTLSRPVDTTRGDVGTFTNQSVALSGLWTCISIWYILFIKNHNDNGHLASIFYYLCQKAFLSSIYYSTCCLSEKLIIRWITEWQTIFPRCLVKLITDIYITRYDSIYFQRFFHSLLSSCGWLSVYGYNSQ